MSRCFKPLCACAQTLMQIWHEDVLLGQTAALCVKSRVLRMSGALSCYTHALIRHANDKHKLGTPRQPRGNIIYTR